MSFLAFIKNGKKVKNNFMPAKYPASRVSYDDNGTETNVQAKVSELNADIIKIKSDTFSGTTTSLGQFVLYQGTNRLPLAIKFTSIGSASGGFILMNESGGSTYVIAQMVGGTIASQAISGIYYYVEL